MHLSNALLALFLFSMKHTFQTIMVFVQRQQYEQRSNQIQFSTFRCRSREGKVVHGAKTGRFKGNHDIWPKRWKWKALNVVSAHRFRSIIFGKLLLLPANKIWVKVQLPASSNMVCVARERVDLATMELVLAKGIHADDVCWLAVRNGVAICVNTISFARRNFSHRCCQPPLPTMTIPICHLTNKC